MHGAITGFTVHDIYLNTASRDGNRVRLPTETVQLAQLQLKPTQSEQSNIRHESKKSKIEKIAICK